MAERLRVLLAGAGYVGTALGLSLARADHTVFALSRNPDALPRELSPMRADLTDPETLTRLPEGLDFAVFSASAGESLDEAYVRVYVRGLSNLLEALAPQQSLRRVFFTSSTAVYAQDDGSWVDEQSPTEPTHFSGRRTLEAEQVAATSVVPTTVFRCSGIYGPGRSRLVASVRDGSARIPSNDHFTNRIHRDDLAGALRYFMERGIAEDRVLVSDDDPAPYSDVVSWLAERLGVPRPPVENTGKRSRGGNKRCRNGKLRALGYELRFPTFREGYSAQLASEH